MKHDLRSYRTFQALILGALGVFLLFRIGDGGILRYINQRYLLLVLGAALAFILLGQVMLQARPKLDHHGEIPFGLEENHDHGFNHAGEGDHEDAASRNWGLLLLTLPLLVGLLLPQRALGSSAAALRGLGTGGVAPSSTHDSLAVPPEQRDVIEWIRALEGAPEPETLNGQSADITGFVYRDDRTPAEHFYASRFTITCCAADAAAYGIEVDWPNENAPAEDSWVRVRGPIEVISTNERPHLLIHAQNLEIIPEPVQPYLFP
jgi:uncharacterized repeat protein (TIGR03943 family)